MTSKLRSIIDAYADAFEAHETSCVDYGVAVAVHDGPRKRRDATHRAALESARARYRETSDAVRAARGAILAALESDR
jgi:hypothetical protein